MFEDRFFSNKKINWSKLEAYGFVKTSDGYQYTTTVMDGQLKLLVNITAKGVVSTQMLDTANHEEYVLYKVESAAGPYVGAVRAACESVLIDIAAKCYEPDVFHCEQTIAIIQYVREKYGDELEFLWEKFADNAIWRCKDTQKWYGLIVAISKKKLGLKSEEMAEAIILRLRPEEMEKTIDHQRYFPGWHMNKKSWYTIILDDSVSLQEIYHRIDESYGLAVK